jgi:hypothetical protein
VSDTYAYYISQRLNALAGLDTILLVVVVTFGVLLTLSLNRIARAIENLSEDEEDGA